MRNSIIIILLTLIPIIIFGQDQTTFVEQVEKCYQNAKFKDINYRLSNEKICFEGLKFPAFKLRSINDELINNELIEGKVTVINFWFTACPPCLEEFPKFNTLIDEINSIESLEIVFIAPTTDNRETIIKFLKQYGELKSIILPNSLPLLRNTLASKSGFPTTIVIDKNGIIYKYYSGGIADFDKFKNLIINLTNNE